MNIMSTKPFSLNGQYEFQEDWIGDIPPDFLETTVGQEEFYTEEGFVIPTIEDDKIVAITPNAEARMAWRATQPEQIRADVDFIAAMQGVSL